MANITVHFKVKLKWWLKLYLKGLTFFCYVTGEIPNWNKVEAVCKNGFIITTGEIK